LGTAISESVPHIGSLPALNSPGRKHSSPIDQDENLVTTYGSII